MGLLVWLLPMVVMLPVRWTVMVCGRRVMSSLKIAISHWLQKSVSITISPKM